MLLFRWHKIEIEDFDFDNILLDELSCENILIYDISHKAFIGAKPLRISLDKVNILSEIYQSLTEYLVLFGSEKYDANYKRSRYLISQKVESHTFSAIIMHKLQLIHVIICL